MLDQEEHCRDRELRERRGNKRKDRVSQRDEMSTIQDERGAVKGRDSRLKITGKKFKE